MEEEMGKELGRKKRRGLKGIEEMRGKFVKIFFPVYEKGMDLLHVGRYINYHKIHIYVSRIFICLLLLLFFLRNV